MNETPPLPFFIRKSKRNFTALVCFWLRKKEELRRWTFNGNAKTFTKQENLKSQRYSHDFHLKMIGEAYLFFLSTEFRATHTKIIIRLPQLAPTWTLYQTNLKKTWQLQRFTWNLFFKIQQVQKLGLLPFGFAYYLSTQQPATLNFTS